MPGSTEPECPLVRTELIHSRCGKPAREHPHPGIAEQVCPFPALPLPGFARVEPEVSVRVCGLPDPGCLSPELESILGALARRVREEYGIGVEVTADDPEQYREALDVIRRGLGL